MNERINVVSSGNLQTLVGSSGDLMHTKFTLLEFCDVSNLVFYKCCYNQMGGLLLWLQVPLCMWMKKSIENIGLGIALV